MNECMQFALDHKFCKLLKFYNARKLETVQTADWVQNNPSYLQFPYV